MAALQQNNPSNEVVERDGDYSSLSTPSREITPPLPIVEEFLAHLLELKKLDGVGVPIPNVLQRYHKGFSDLVDSLWKELLERDSSLISARLEVQQGALGIKLQTLRPEDIAHIEQRSIFRVHFLPWAVEQDFRDPITPDFSGPNILQPKTPHSRIFKERSEVLFRESESEEGTIKRSYALNLRQELVELIEFAWSELQRVSPEVKELEEEKQSEKLDRYIQSSIETLISSLSDRYQKINKADEIIHKRSAWKNFTRWLRGDLVLPEPAISKEWKSELASQDLKESSRRIFYMRAKTVLMSVGKKFFEQAHSNLTNLSENELSDMFDSFIRNNLSTIAQEYIQELRSNTKMTNSTKKGMEGALNKFLTWQGKERVYLKDPASRTQERKTKKATKTETKKPVVKKAHKKKALKKPVVKKSVKKEKRLKAKPPVPNVDNQQVGKTKEVQRKVERKNASPVTEKIAKKMSKKALPKTTTKKKVVNNSGAKKKPSEITVVEKEKPEEARVPDHKPVNQKHGEGETLERQTVRKGPAPSTKSIARKVTERSLPESTPPKIHDKKSTTGDRSQERSVKAQKVSATPALPEAAPPKNTQTSNKDSSVTHARPEQRTTKVANEPQARSSHGLSDKAEAFLNDKDAQQLTRQQRRNRQIVVELGEKLFKILREKYGFSSEDLMEIDALYDVRQEGRQVIITIGFEQQAVVLLGEEATTAREYLLGGMLDASGKPWDSANVDRPLFFFLKS